MILCGDCHRSIPGYEHISLCHPLAELVCPFCKRWVHPTLPEWIEKKRKVEKAEMRREARRLARRKVLKKGKRR